MLSASTARLVENAALLGEPEMLGIKGSDCPIPARRLLAVGVVGPAGIGKTRLIGEATRLAASGDVEVFATACESHTKDIPFHAVMRRRCTGPFGPFGTPRTASAAWRH